MFCSYVENDELCGKPAKIHDNLVVCETHRRVLANRNLDRSKRALLKALEADETAEHFVYVLKVATGNVKIGVTRVDQLYTRLQSLHRSFGGRHEIIAVVRGGYALEAELHVRYADHRVTTLLGEQFDPVILADFEDWGVARDAYPAVANYEAYEPTRATKVNPDYVGDLLATV